jgi:hypothetical protein
MESQRGNYFSDVTKVLLTAPDEALTNKHTTVHEGVIPLRL